MVGQVAGLELRIVDATVINGPGSNGAEWRAHVQIDAASGRLRAVELTDVHGGERLDRQRFTGGEVVLGDRAYGTARGAAWVHGPQAEVLVRFNRSIRRRWACVARSAARSIFKARPERFRP
jgi:hypothetical protein